MLPNSPPQCRAVAAVFAGQAFGVQFADGIIRIRTTDGVFQFQIGEFPGRVGMMAGHHLVEQHAQGVGITGCS